MFKETISDWVKQKIQYHTASMDSVEPFSRFSSKENAIYLNSCAGLIRFTSRDQYEIDLFRNVFVNEFHRIESNKKAYFSLYSRIINRTWSDKARVKYKANLRTMLRYKIAS